MGSLSGGGFQAGGPWSGHSHKGCWQFKFHMGVADSVPMTGDVPS